MHWTRRGLHESNSDFGQWVHDSIPREFWLMDDDTRPDHYTFGKLSTRIFREIEHKFRGQKLSNGQAELMPLLARGIQHLIDEGWVSPFSGAFVVYTDPPYVTASAEKVHPDGSRSLPIRLFGGQVERFIGCEVAP